jgi:molybdopterin biosynthesis enzyme MoaB
MTKQEIIDSIRVLTELLKYSYSEKISESLIKDTVYKIKELLKLL